MGKDIEDIPDLVRILSSPDRTDISAHYDKRMRKDLAKNLIRGNVCETCDEYWGDAEDIVQTVGGSNLNSSNCYRFVNKPKHGSCPWFNIPVVKKKKNG